MKEDSEQEMNTPAFGVTPLGVTIARKQLEGEDLLEKQQIKKTHQRKELPLSTTATTTTATATLEENEETQNRLSSRKKQIITTTSVTKKLLNNGKKISKKKNASWMALVEGVTLYGLCLILPSMLGIIMRLNVQQVLDVWENVQVFICQRSTPWICWTMFGRVWPPEPEHPLTFDNFASDTHLSDVYVVALLTFSMALVRVWLVHMLVPNNLAPQQMEALVRCKSIHLLSSEYKKTLTPRETPRSVITWESLDKKFAATSARKDRRRNNQSSSKGGTAAPVASSSSAPTLPSLPQLDHGVSQLLHHAATSSCINESPTPLWHRPEEKFTTPPRSTTQDETDPAGNVADDDDDYNYDIPRRNLEKSAFHDISSTLRNDVGLSLDTPVRKGDAINKLDSTTPAMMGGFLGSCGPKDNDSDNRPLVDDSERDLMMDDSDDDDNEIPQTQPLAPTVSTPMTQSPLPSMLFQQWSGTPDPTADDNNDAGEVIPWKRRGSTASLAAAAAAAVQEEGDDPSDNDVDFDVVTIEGPAPKKEDSALSPLNSPAVVRRKSQRLFAAPRYATAVFRLLYCGLSCTMAWYLFRDADFWPSYVGGHGSTARCWDLSGTLALAKNLDSDFDHRNTVLRRFFLVQASYHLHSGAFHVFSVMLLFFLKKEDDFGTSRKKTKKDWLSLLRSLIHPRALLQHTLSLFFLSVSYVFSSLRRLGAIGMFALDMSSLALHLLQTCLNAPSDSILSQKKVIRGVWALLVVPSFLYFRFYVWPMVGYSAWVESKHWLSQLESTLFPGCAIWFRWTFQTWMALWMGFHAIHFKRLFFHPHIQRIMAVNSEEANGGLQETPSL